MAAQRTADKTLTKYLPANCLKSAFYLLSNKLLHGRHKAAQGLVLDIEKSPIDLAHGQNPHRSAGNEGRHEISPPLGHYALKHDLYANLRTEGQNVLAHDPAEHIRINISGVILSLKEW